MDGIAIQTAVAAQSIAFQMHYCPDILNVPPRCFFSNAQCNNLPPSPLPLFNDALMASSKPDAN